MIRLSSTFLKSLQIFCLTVILWGTVSCDDFDNNSGANLDDPTILAPLLLPNILNRIAWEYHAEHWYTTCQVMQYCTILGGSTNDRYGWKPINWNVYYTSARDAQNLEQFGKEIGNSNYEGIGLLLKTYIFSILTDLYGDVPYSEALKGKQDTFKPKYDKQEDIYPQLIAELEKASLLINPQNAKPITGDILFGGDLLKWKKFANSLIIRLLMRISNKKNIQVEISKIVAEGIIMTSPSDDAGIKTGSFVDFIGFTRGDDAFDNYRMSLFLDNNLHEIQDPRLKVMFRATDASINTDTVAYRGMPNGLQDGLYLGNAVKFVSRLGTRYRVNGIERANFMLYSELQFLLAEAAEKGWINASAETHYLNGIQADMARYEVNMGNDYLQHPKVKYEGTKTEKLEKIGFQKWIALFFVGTEAWIDWRRTGFPKISPALRNLNQDKIPVRFIYPQNEQILNPEGYQSVIQIQGEDNINTKMWLIKN
jgi:hypothetical protein